jgi:hypothetical protein
MGWRCAAAADPARHHRSRGRGDIGRAWRTGGTDGLDRGTPRLALLGPIQARVLAADTKADRGDAPRTDRRKVAATHTILILRSRGAASRRMVTGAYAAISAREARLLRMTAVVWRPRCFPVIARSACDEAIQPSWTGAPGLWIASHIVRRFAPPDGSQ